MFFCTSASEQRHSCRKGLVNFHTFQWLISMHTLHLGEFKQPLITLILRESMIKCEKATFLKSKGILVF